MTEISERCVAKRQSEHADDWFPEIITLLIWVAIFWGAA